MTKMKWTICNATVAIIILFLFLGVTNAELHHGGFKLRGQSWQLDFSEESKCVLPDTIEIIELGGVTGTITSDDVAFIDSVHQELCVVNPDVTIQGNIIRAASGVRVVETDKLIQPLDGSIWNQSQQSTFQDLYYEKLDTFRDSTHFDSINIQHEFDLFYVDVAKGECPAMVVYIAEYAGALDSYRIYNWLYDSECNSYTAALPKQNFVGAFKWALSGGWLNIYDGNGLNTDVELISPKGEVLRTTKIHGGAAALDISNFSSGMYILRLQPSLDTQKLSIR
jgi:hypothetical protein